MLHGKSLSLFHVLRCVVPARLFSHTTSTQVQLRRCVLDGLMLLARERLGDAAADVPDWRIWYALGLHEALQARFVGQLFFSLTAANFS